MIAGTKNDLKRYRGIDTRIDRCIDYILSHDLSSLPLGRTDIDDDLYISSSANQLGNEEDKRWEAHEKHLDLQYGLTDGELIAWLPIPEVEGFGELLDGDIRFSDDPVKGALIPLNKDCFVLLFPEDAHKPGIGSGKGHKAVFKISCD